MKKDSAAHYSHGEQPDSLFIDPSLLTYELKVICVAEARLELATSSQ